MTDSAFDLSVVLQSTFVAGGEHHATVGSTNELARQRAQELGRSLPWLVVADRQTAGRGRGENQWWSPAGNLMFSLLVDRSLLPSEAARLPLVSLAAAVAVVEAVEPLVRPRVVGLHWPNDVVAAGRKLAGILIEGLSDGRQIIGIGLNVDASMADAPPDVLRRATSLGDLAGCGHDRGLLLISILRKLAQQLELLRTCPEKSVARAAALCLQKGDTVTIECGGRATTGRCEGIDADGGLILATSAGREVFCTGVLRQPPA